MAAGVHQDRGLTEPMPSMADQTDVGKEREVAGQTMSTGFQVIHVLVELLFSFVSHFSEFLLHFSTLNTGFPFENADNPASYYLKIRKRTKGWGGGGLVNKTFRRIRTVVRKKATRLTERCVLSVK